MNLLRKITARGKNFNGAQNVKKEQKINSGEKWGKARSGKKLQKAKNYDGFG